jgi:hypothetical protein
MKQLFANDAVGNLAEPLAPDDVVVSLDAGDGELFPTPGANEFFVLTITDKATKLIKEITYCTSRVGDICTVVRGQEDTPALAWSVGDIIYNPVTAATAANWSQEFFTQQQPDNFGLDTGTENNCVVALTYQPLNFAALTGMPIRVLKNSLTNTGPVDLEVNGFAPAPVVKVDGSPLVAGELPADGIFYVISTGTVFMLMSGTAGSGNGGKCFQVGFDNPPNEEDIVIGYAIDVPFDTKSGTGTTGGLPICFDPNGMFQTDFVNPQFDNCYYHGTATGGNLTAVSTGQPFFSTPWLPGNRYQVTGPGVPAGVFVTGIVSGDSQNGVYSLNVDLEIPTPTNFVLQNLISAFVAQEDGIYLLFSELYWIIDPSVYFGDAVGVALYYEHYDKNGIFVSDGETQTILNVPESTKRELQATTFIQQFFKMSAGDYVWLIAGPLNHTGAGAETGLTIVAGYCTIFGGQKVG